ncbi:MAG: hypothetical protein B5766_01505 [Candidatus Lumbricidophila eiseniae]|uniref:GntR C-terminal domain-containing protein n=1 Tax=Candidatus Lumbricidiphila eiseniae TaxID=1969409 RepID=A0A2A6FUK8_9MICO|nr:MAG: hypothetical protein B5766_01505 [Candidatus Lumbricidophila eiseniae]
MRERYEFRIIVEPAAAALAAQRRTGDEVAHILELTDTDRISAALDGGDNEDEILMEGDSRLHQAVTRASHNSLLCSQLDPVFLRMREYGTYRNRDSLRRAWEEHREIVLAIHRRDASAAFAAMHTHLTNAVERFQTAFSIKSD